MGPGVPGELARVDPRVEPVPAVVVGEDELAGRGEQVELRVAQRGVVASEKLGAERRRVHDVEGVAVHVVLRLGLGAVPKEPEERGAIVGDRQGRGIEKVARVARRPVVAVRGLPADVDDGEVDGATAAAQTHGEVRVEAGAVVLRHRRTEIDLPSLAFGVLDVPRDARDEEASVFVVLKESVRDARDRHGALHGTGGHEDLKARGAGDVVGDGVVDAEPCPIVIEEVGLDRDRRVPVRRPAQDGPERNGPTVFADALRGEDEGDHRRVRDHVERGREVVLRVDVSVQGDVVQQLVERVDQRVDRSGRRGVGALRPGVVHDRPVRKRREGVGTEYGGRARSGAVAGVDEKEEVVVSAAHRVRAPGDEPGALERENRVARPLREAEAPLAHGCRALSPVRERDRRAHVDGDHGPGRECLERHQDLAVAAAVRKRVRTAGIVVVGEPDLGAGRDVRQEHKRELVVVAVAAEVGVDGDDGEVALGERRAPGWGFEGLPGVDGARGGVARAAPAKVAVLRAGPRELKGLPVGLTASFGDTDVRARGARRTRYAAIVSVGGKRAFIGEELHDGSASVDKREPVRASVLDARLVKREGAKAGPLVIDGACEANRAVQVAVGAVVQLDRPPGEVRTGRTCDLDELAGVGAGVVVVELVDKHVLRARGGRREGHGSDRQEERGSGEG